LVVLAVVREYSLIYFPDSFQFIERRRGNGGFSWGLYTFFRKKILVTDMVAIQGKELEKMDSPKRTALGPFSNGSGDNLNDILEFEDESINTQQREGLLRLTERIQLEKPEFFYKICHAAKNLYNQANYLIKTAREHERRWMHYNELYEALKGSDNYKALPAQTAQQILLLLDKNWKSYFSTVRDWREYPEKYQSEPKPPKYKPKPGESIVIFTNQQCQIKDDYLYFPKKACLPPIKINPERVSAFQQVRLLPQRVSYMVEIVYEKEVELADVDPGRVLALDLGVNNLVCGVNNVGLRPFVVKGGAVKSINQFYNKQRAKYQSLKDQQGTKGMTNRLSRITQNRNNRIGDLFHQLSHALIEYCLAHHLGTIVVGYNPQWKLNCNLGKKNNQNFANIPFQKLVHHLQYKAALLGIQVQQVLEDHTSKCSFLDNEPVEHREAYVGKRIKRGLFRAKTGQVINADVNGAYNILRKAFPKGISPDGIVGLGFVPYAVKLTELNQFENLNPPQTTQSRKLSADGIVAPGIQPMRSMDRSHEPQINLFNDSSHNL
jgi:putative transposase